MLYHCTGSNMRGKNVFLFIGWKREMVEGIIVYEATETFYKVSRKNALKVSHVRRVDFNVVFEEVSLMEIVEISLAECLQK